MGICWKIEPGCIAIFKTIVGKEVVDPKMTGIVSHIINAGMGEVGQHVGSAESGHGDLGDHHLEKRREGAKNSLAARLRAKTGGHRVVVAFHDAARNIDFWVVLANMVETAGAFKIGVDNDDLVGRIFHGIENFADDFAKIIAALSGFGRGTQIGRFVLCYGCFLRNLCPDCH